MIGEQSPQADFNSPAPPLTHEGSLQGLCAPSTVASATYSYRASAHPCGAFYRIGDEVSYTIKNIFLIDPPRRLFKKMFLFPEDFLLNQFLQYLQIII